MRRITIKQRLFIVVAAAVFPLALMSAAALYVGYQEQRKQVERSGLDIARALSTAVDAELRRTISVLDVLGRASAFGRGESAALYERAAYVLKSQPNWHKIIMFDAQGRRMLDVGGNPGPADRPPAEPASFTEVVRTRQPLIGYLALDRGPQWAFAVRVPVVANGELVGILTAVLKPEAILSVLQGQRVPGDWVVAAADAKGVRVARTRAHVESVGTPYSPSLARMMQSSEEGTSVTHTSEGDEVFTAWTRSRETHWYVAVGQSTAVVNAQARQYFYTLGGGAALSILIGLAAALVLARRVTNPMADLRDAALAMGHGAPVKVPETDLAEIHDVGTTLARAAEAQSAARAEREELLRREQAARAAAEGANRAKDEFLAMLGHELRNPLGAISNASALLANPALPANGAARARDVIARQVGHLTRLTDDLLDASRALTGKIALRPVALDVAEVAAQSLATLRASQRLRGHRVVEQLESAWTEVDPIRLDQIISNLLVNAAKYTPEDGTIRLTVRREGDEAVLRVADDGIGLEPELAARVFDLFVQGERELDRTQGGLGIGLTLVRRLAEMHGGSASVHSDGTGKGSEFTVRFPAIAPVQRAQHSAPARAGAKGRDILVVEDNPDARDTLRELLELLGHRVETASDGVAAVEMALAFQPEIALIDVGLPKLNGYEVAQRIRASNGGRRPYLVAVTGYGMPEDRQRALEAGFDAHVTKPVEIDALGELLAAPVPPPEGKPRTL
jgi:signal transduction histidine kinase/ActR/RegA family two-component response regulator